MTAQYKTPRIIDIVYYQTSLPVRTCVAIEGNIFPSKKVFNRTNFFISSNLIKTLRRLFVYKESISFLSLLPLIFVLVFMKSVKRAEKFC